MLDVLTDWSDALVELAGGRFDDVYCRPAYAALYLKDGARAEALRYRRGGDTLLLPWLVRPIEGPALPRIAYDFETPYGYGGPLSSTDDPAFLAEAWQAIEDHCRAIGVVCGFLRFHPFFDNQRWVSGSAMTVVRDRDTVILSLDKSPDTVWNGYASGTRSKVRKAQRQGVTVTPYTDVESLAVFSKLYRSHMEELDAHQDYFFDDAYFDGISRLGGDAWTVYLARLGDVVIGGALVLTSQRWAHYHLSSSPREFSAYAPNNILRHTVAMALLGSGRERIHFGGGRTADPEDSLLRFKAGFSPERASFHFGKFTASPDAYATLCDWWAETYPHLVERFAGRFLRYRYR